MEGFADCITQVGSTIMPLSPDGLFPAVGMHSLGEEVRLHLHAELGNEEDDSIMMVDSYEDEWGRLHDVKVCGTVSERWKTDGQCLSLDWVPALNMAIIPFLPFPLPWVSCLSGFQREHLGPALQVPGQS